MAIAGRVAIVPKGDWSADATYKRLDAVTHNNTLYFAKKDVPAGTATSNTDYWSKSIVGGVGAIATTEDAGVVKPDGKSMSVDESGTLSINLDETTITLDEAKNVIKLADTLKEKIGSALQPESIVNNQITTVEGFALDARQANPNIDGTLAKQVADLNGSLKNSQEIRLDTGIYFGYSGHIGSLRFSSANISNGQKIQLPDGIVDILGTGLAIAKGSNNIYVISVGDANIQIRDNNWNIVQSIENIRGGLVVNVVY